MLVVGLTGGMGSGKSTVTDLFAKKGVPIIDADQIAHALTERGQPAFKQIIAHFGKQLLDETGRLNRRALKEIIFKSPFDRSWLEQLLHPLILQQIQQTFKTLSASYCIVVIPLLIETGPYTFIDRILVIDAPETIQTERIYQRDHLQPAEITAILKTQTTREARNLVANDIIENNGTLTQLAAEVERLHTMYDTAISS